MRNKIRYYNLLCLLSLPALPLSALAACIPPLCACTTSASGVAFGTYNPFSGSNLDAAGNVSVTCGGLAGIVSYSIVLSRGIYSADFYPRQMGSGANRLNYNLYTSNGYGTIWGDSSGSTGIISDSYLVVASDTTRNYPVYGRIPASQTSAAVGSYSDTITVTVTYN